MSLHQDWVCPDLTDLKFKYTAKAQHLAISSTLQVQHIASSSTAMTKKQEGA